MADLTFKAGGRGRRLFRKYAGGNYYVRFQYQGHDELRSTDTTNVGAAKEKGRELIEAALGGDVELARKLQVKSGAPTLRQVADIYITNYAQDRRRHRTANNNAGALAKIVKSVTGLSLEDARANCLTAELVRKFQELEEQRIERDRRGFVKQLSELRVRTSIASWVRQAKSIFAKANMHWYENLNLPSLTEFKAQGVRQPDRPRPEPMDPSILNEINKAVRQLSESDPACYVAHLLFKYLGMRNSEIKYARRSWILKSATGARLGIKIRPAEEFKPKAKTSRDIPIAASVLAEIERHWSASPDGDYLVPAPNKTIRAEIVDRRHSKWVGQWIKNRSKVSYELRRYAGWMMYQKTLSLAHVQKFLGHADLKTTTDWYFGIGDNELPAIDPTDFVARVAA